MVVYLFELFYVCLRIVEVPRVPKILAFGLLVHVVHQKMYKEYILDMQV